MVQTWVYKHVAQIPDDFKLVTEFLKLTKSFTFYVNYLADNVFQLCSCELLESITHTDKNEQH